MAYNLITILGPTAVGKTRLAALLANRFDGEIISADSRQVYKGMDIGTGKDLDDYNIDGKVIPFHLIDIYNPKDEFNVFYFNKFFFESLDDVILRNKIPFLCGGTGLYLHSVLKGYQLKSVPFSQQQYDDMNKFTYDELVERLKRTNIKLHNTTDLATKDRVIRAIMIEEQEEIVHVDKMQKINSLNLGVKLDRSEIRNRITTRLKFRLQNGMIEEVERLISEGVSFERLEQFGLEYKFLAKYLKKELNYEEMFERLNTAIHQFAKRQMTWYRKMEKEGIEINWLNGPNYQEAESIILQKYFS